MDFVKKFTGGSEQSGESQQQQATAPGGQQEEGGFLSGIGNKINTAAGGGRESEKNEDALDKAVDMFQEKVLGQGPQDNESAVEQAKDEQISDFIRSKYKDTTGSDIPIKDKETRFG
ncbi:hypothetical protein K461DRAFT_275627 [Myriangium duriaei CBS 260.36]|uniref:DNA damage-responsive protein 48 n=1 Tax=Myriangium duriaei CBS 260.36 TaxID=1168546 RepID=A0A9P4J8Z5_9PEZI|nr:hypothetical protein K461DRAFT_275627 [Myriangium duriaei CBS 260.36]